MFRYEFVKLRADIRSFFRNSHIFRIQIKQFHYFTNPLLRTFKLRMRTLIFCCLIVNFLLPKSSFLAQSTHIVSAGVQMDEFSEFYNNMYLSFVSYGYETKSWTSISKLNYTNRFEKSGYQLDLETYHKFKSGKYVYLGYAYSGSELFPKNRAGAELFVPFQKKWEWSTGLRFLNFKTGTSSLFYTGSLSWYFKSYLFSVRPYIIPAGDKLAGSLNLSARKYLNDTDAIGIRLGIGSSPDERIVQLSEGVQGKDILLLNSQIISIYANKVFKKKLNIRASISMSKDELAFRNDYFIRHGIYEISFTYRF